MALGEVVGVEVLCIVSFHTLLDDLRPAAHQASAQCLNSGPQSLRTHFSGLLVYFQPNSITNALSVLKQKIIRH